MMELPSCLDPVEPLARAVYESGWRRPFTPGRTVRNCAASSPPPWVGDAAQVAWFSVAVSGAGIWSEEVAQLARKRNAWEDVEPGAAV
jgi:hypothetical protein